ncbi:HIT family protein [Candidatus Woesearchaeota archaeon]|jgi:histidine triad (HIT) family protein|nr:HIT family protein [Candidatus Woesearchaeota archaeon]|tara:strand:- start:5536 stop:5952 length:417 start_codon:yes stop_codon:yes gene_type:complete
MKTEDCVFCKIVDGKVPAAKIYEDAMVIAFLDIMPANKGHCLIIPKKHVPTLVEMDDKDLAATILAVKKIAKAVSLSFGNTGFNLVMNNGKEAGQVVHHAHLHIIPRFQKDRLRIKWSHLKYENDEIKKYADNIKKFL